MKESTNKKKEKIVKKSEYKKISKELVETGAFRSINTSGSNSFLFSLSLSFFPSTPTTFSCQFFFFLFSFSSFSFDSKRTWQIEALGLRRGTDSNQLTLGAHNTGKTGGKKRGKKLSGKKSSFDFCLRSFFQRLLAINEGQGWMGSS